MKIRIALAELWGGIWFGAAGDGWGRYDEALRRSLLQRATVDVGSRAGSGSTYEQCVAQGEVAYHPHEIAITRPDQEQPSFWNLTPYVLHVPFSGNVCISMRQQARVLALLTRRDSEPPYLAPEQKWIMAGRPAPGVSRRPLGWGSSEYEVFFQDGDRMLRVTKNGGNPGTRAWVTHWFPGPGSSLPEETTFDLAIAVNGDCNLGGPMGDLFAAAREVEAESLWSPVDLTDGTPFDEDP